MRASSRDYLIIGLYLGVYCLSFSLNYPVCTTNSDETFYLRQANAFALGRLWIIATDPLTG